MLYSGLIEVRQHLCCANIFLKLRDSFTDLQPLKIIVDETKIRLQNSEYCADLFVDKHFLISAATFSNLIVENKNISFRFSVRDILVSENDEIDDRNNLKINLKENNDASVMCSSCYSILATKNKYNKVREFPSGAIDVSGFFCHHGPNFDDILVPSISDVFYGFFFIVLNIESVNKATRQKDEHIYCKRCLRYLGETMFNGRAVKLWCESIRFNEDEENLEIFAADGRTDIHKLMLKALDETSLPNPGSLLKNIYFTKVLFTAFFPNRQQHFLLVHILEKNLQVLRNEEFLQCEIGLKDYQNTYEFKQNKAFKILYRLIESSAEDSSEGTNKWPPMLLYWHQDINILKMKISPYLFTDLYNELDKNADVLPATHRINNEDFLLSYIFY